MTKTLLPCPFCGSTNLYAHDYDHGNGIRWRVCCLGCMGMVDPGTIQQKYRAMEAWNRRAIADNEPLTAEELRQFDGEPVYLEFGDGGQGWAIACNDGEWMRFAGVDFEDECPEMAFLNMEHQDPAGHYGLHVLGWRAYRSKPMKEGQNAE